MIEIGNAKVFFGSNLDVLPTLPDNSVDSIVTDPPYELGFMGKKWDSSGIAYSVELWQECLRVLKPGGHLLSFGGTRTFHRMAVAIEDAGFEVRDSIAWLYGSGFPKSLDVSKAIDKAAGAERTEVIGSRSRNVKPFDDSNGWNENNTTGNYEYKAPATDDAKKWQGWGTALKPAFEPVVVARKPLVGTVAANVLEWGVGGLNIDGSRIGTEQRFNSHAGNKNTGFTSDDDRTDAGKGLFAGNSDGGSTVQGRWPANIILDEYTAGLLDEQSEDVSRFFYVSKTNKKDRNEGLENLPDYDWRNEGAAIPERENRPFLPSKNHHPTVKPTTLMEYLVKLVTPPNGTVLDPFTGSGSTGKAALLNGFKFIGIELTEEYLPIIEGRLRFAAEQFANKKEEEKETLF